MYPWHFFCRAVVKGNSPDRREISPERYLEHKERRKSNRNSKYLSE
jgi:hypothetical protein